MTRRIPLIARDVKRMYTGFLIAAVILFILCSYLTEFNVMTLIANGDAFWEFITEDFLPPALPRASRIPGIFSSILVTLAMSSTTIAAVLAFFVALFGSEKVSPFPRAAKLVRGFATFLRNIPALVWALYPFFLPGNRDGRRIRGPVHHKLCLYGAGLCGDHGGCVPGLCGEPAGRGRLLPPAGEPGDSSSCLSGFLSWFLYCVEVNIRASTIVGMVGGGGVGLTLFSYIKSFRYDIALSIILLIAAMVIVVEQITNKLRKEILK